MNFLRRLVLLGEKKLDDSSRLDVVEIARVPEISSEFVSFLVELKTYQHPGNNTVHIHTELVASKVYFRLCDWHQATLS